jgi:Ca2+-binding EF-hand superfamily protein
MFDDDDDGHLSVAELTEVVTGLGDRLNQNELSSMIKQAGQETYS